MKFLLRFVMLAIFFLSGCRPSSNQKTTVPIQTIVVIVPTRQNLVSPTIQSTLTPESTVSKDVKITLSVDQNPPNPINIKYGQRLIVIPPVGWGQYGWDVSYDQSLIELAPNIDPNMPTNGMWIWTIVKTGECQISIMAIRPPCASQTNPCVFPDFKTNLHIKIIP